MAVLKRQVGSIFDVLKRSLGEKQPSVLTFYSPSSDLLYKDRRKVGGAGDCLPQHGRLFPGALTALGLPGSLNYSACLALFYRKKAFTANPV